MGPGNLSGVLRQTPCIIAAGGVVDRVTGGQSDREICPNHLPGNLGCNPHCAGTTQGGGCCDQQARRRISLHSLSEVLG